MSTSPSPSPYRNEIESLRERKEALERDLARLGEQTSQLEGLRAQQAELERELHAVSQRLGASGRRTLPLLDQVSVASPCNASWDEMVGDERVRFCLSCEKNVYNLSAMNAADAERLLAERAGNEPCVRYYRRADGTLMTSDCPVGAKKKRRKKLALAIAGAGAMAFAATAALARETTTCTTRTMGALKQPTDGTTTSEPPQPPVMGSMVAPEPPPPPPPPQKHIQGRLVRPRR